MSSKKRHLFIYVAIKQASLVTQTLQMQVWSLGLEDPQRKNGYLPQYSWQENSMDRGAWRATVHAVAKSQTWLSNVHFQFTFMIPPSGSYCPQVEVSSLHIQMVFLERYTGIHIGQTASGSSASTVQRSYPKPTEDSVAKTFKKHEVKNQVDLAPCLVLPLNTLFL